MAYHNPITIKWMINAKTKTNFKTKNLQIDVTRIWLLSFKQYNKWMFEGHFFFFLGNMLVGKTYIVFISLLWVN